ELGGTASKELCFYLQLILYSYCAYAVILPWHKCQVVMFASSKLSNGLCCGKPHLQPALSLPRNCLTVCRRAQRWQRTRGYLSVSFIRNVALTNELGRTETGQPLVKWVADCKSGLG